MRCAHFRKYAIPARYRPPSQLFPGPANVRHPQHLVTEKDDCFSKSEKKTGNQKKKPRLEAVTIPLTECKWNEMKEQNERLLAFLSQDIGESPHDQVGDEMLTPKRAKNVKQEWLMTRASRMNQWSQITMTKLI